MPNRPVLGQISRPQSWPERQQTPWGPTPEIPSASLHGPASITRITNISPIFTSRLQYEHRNLFPLMPASRIHFRDPRCMFLRWHPRRSRHPRSTIVPQDAKQISHHAKPINPPAMGQTGCGRPRAIKPTESSVHTPN
jgi:hypothetical protein